MIRADAFKATRGSNIAVLGRSQRQLSSIETPCLAWATQSPRKTEWARWAVSWNSPIWRDKVNTMRYAIVIENAGGNFSGYVPDLPGCVATGSTTKETE